MFKISGNNAFGNDLAGCIIVDNKRNVKHNYRDREKKSQQTINKLGNITLTPAISVFI